MLEGKGKYVYKGGIYEGEFKHGAKEGYGKETHESGSYYEGEWKDNEMNGKGKYVYKNGSYDEGIWEKGYKRSVVRYDKNGKEVYLKF